MLNKLKLSTKLYLGFGAVLTLMVIISIVSLVNLTRMKENLHDMVDNNEFRMNLLFNMSDRIHVVGRAVRDIVLLNDDVNQEAAMNTLNKARDEYGKSFTVLKSMSASETDRQMQAKIEEDLTKARELNNKVIQLAKSKKIKEAVLAVNEEAAPTVEKVQNGISSYIQYQIRHNKTDYEADKRVSDIIFLVTIVLTAVNFILGSFVAFFLTRGISGRINRIAASLAEGANQVASASQEVAATSQELAAGNSEQASSIEETSSTLEESASMIRQNSENTRQAALLAGETKASADRGNAEMQEMMTSMTEIKKSSDQISKIIKVIDEIAFQTNILALNAAVEAARAGDAGMGFAVVAEEVRNLAQRSAQAAKDTSAIIETNIELSDQGVNVSRRVGDSLREITAQAKKVTELMDEIAAASQEQSQGISQINKAISQMEKVTQQNAANAEESASASVELSAQAETLQEIVYQLMQLVNGQNTTAQMTETKPGAQNVSGNRALKNTPIQKQLSVRQENPKISGPVKRTRVVNPEEIIPLEDDTDGF